MPGGDYNQIIDSIEEKIFNEYMNLSLRYPPRFTQVSTESEAWAKLRDTSFDLIIVMPGTDNNDTFEILVDGEVHCRITGNRQRLVTLPIGKTASRIALRPVKTTGTAETAHVFSFDFA